MTKVIRAVLIDSIKCEIYEVGTDGSLAHTLELIGGGCTCITGVSCIISITKHALYVDDDGLFNKRKGAFKIPCVPGYCNPDGEPWQVISGNGIIVGINDEGADVSCTLSLEEIRSLVKFVSTEDLPDPGFTLIH